MQWKQLFDVKSSTANAGQPLASKSTNIFDDTNGRFTKVCDDANVKSENNPKESIVLDLRECANGKLQHLQQDVINNNTNFS